jgi:uncharacterized protein (DUF1015 family)
MAEIAPLHALRYDFTRVADPAAVLAPPYDVIAEAERAALEAAHEHNVVHLDLPRGEGDEKYANAANLLARWITAGVLREDPRPAIYRYEQTFRDPRNFVNGRPARSYVRKGFIALLRLTPLGDGVVLPHERTLSGPKLDRQKLIQATKAHFSQVFTLYRDPGAETDAAFAAAEAEAPAVDAVTADGCRHRLWVVDDLDVIRRVALLVAPKSVMIADGHHRYETMVNLQAELRPADAAPGSALADWGAVFFARAEDPGLLVLPTHRLVKNLGRDILDGVRARAAAFFDSEEGDEAEAGEIEARLAHEGAAQVTFAFRQHGARRTTWFRLRPDARLETLGPPALRGLDVTVLHGLLLGPLLGIDGEAMAKGTHLAYTHDTRAALDEIAAGRVAGGFLMNPTKVEEVLAACEAGFVLPQKSTYFQPKLATGLVMAQINPRRVPVRVG